MVCDCVTVTPRLPLNPQRWDGSETANPNFMPRIPYGCSVVGGSAVPSISVCACPNKFANVCPNRPPCAAPQKPLCFEAHASSRAKTIGFLQTGPLAPHRQWSHNHSHPKIELLQLDCDMPLHMLEPWQRPGQLHDQWQSKMLSSQLCSLW